MGQSERDWQRAVRRWFEPNRDRCLFAHHTLLHDRLLHTSSSSRWRKDHHKGSARALPMWKCEKMREDDKQECVVQDRPRRCQRGRKGRRQRVIAETRPKPCQHGDMSRSGIVGQRSSRRLGQSLASTENCHERVLEGKGHREGSTEALPARNHNPRELKRSHGSFQVASRSASRSQCPARLPGAFQGVRDAKLSQAGSSVAQGGQQDANAAQERKESREGDVESGGGTAKNESNTYHFVGCHLEAVQCSFGRRMIRCPT
jgi:hypothetical protein